MAQTEQERLKAVSHFLNLETNKKQELQQIVALAAEVCGTPTALITMLDKDTQFIRFKQSFDLDEVKREDAFCNYVIEEFELVMIPDATIDKRFADNPLVVNSPFIRFYAGAPLTTHDGYNLGSLCVLDSKPNLLTEEQQKMLTMLSKQVMQLLEFDSSLNILKKQFISSKNSEIKMRAFFDSSSANYVLLNKEYCVVAFNKTVKDFLQFAYGKTIMVGMNITQFIREDYMADFINNCSIALAGESCRHERLLVFGNTSVFCDITYNPARNAEGEIIGVSYNSIDISQRIINQEDLVKRQSALDQIAYMQSHQLRKPVANIKGLLVLLEMEGYADTIPELKEMQKMVDQLDENIAMIVNYAGRNR